MKTLTLDPLYPDGSPAVGTRLTVKVDRDVAIKGQGVIARKNAVKTYTIKQDGTFPALAVVPNDDASLQDWSAGYALIIEAEPTPAGGVTGGPWTVVITSAAAAALRLSDLDSSNVVGLPPNISLGETMSRLSAVESTANAAQANANTAKADAATALATAQATIAPTDNQVAVLADTTSATRTSMRKSFAPYTLATDPTLGGGMATTKTGAQNTSAWNAAMTALSTTGGVLFIPAGSYTMGAGMNLVPGGVSVKGAGMDYSTPPSTTSPRGTRLIAGETMTTMVVLGNTASSSSSGVTSGTLSDILVDGNNLAAIPVQTNARRNILRDVFARCGTDVQMNLAGQNGELHGYNVAECIGGVGECVRITSMPDNKIFEGLNVRGQPDPNKAMIHVVMDGTGSSGGLATGHLKIHGLHAWTGADSTSVPCKALLWIDLSNSSTFQSLDVTGNTFEGQVGPQIRVTVDATSSMTCMNVVGNVAFNGADLPDATHPFILLEGAGAITALNVVGNTIHGKDTNHRYLSILHDAGTGARGRINVNGNMGTYVQYPVTQVAASLLQSVISLGTNDVLASSTVTRRTFVKDYWNATGDGTTTTWTISQPCGMNLKHWMTTPRSASIAFRNWYADSASGNLTIRFVDGSGNPLAPAAGAPLWVNWEATAVVQVI